ncbi:hypothetical protein EV122DRAFT_212168 [Schizophyllum commune]
MQALEINPTARSDARHRGAGVWSCQREEWQSEVKPLIAPRGAAVLTAAINLLKMAEDADNIEIIVPNKGLVQTLTTRMRKFEEAGWVNTPNRNLYITLVAMMRARPGRTAWRVGHELEEGMTRAKTLADRAVRRRKATDTSIRIHPNEVRGAKLACLTQREAYRTIRPKPQEAERKATVPQMKKIKRAQRSRGAREPTRTEIWRAMSVPEFRRPVKQFMFKTVHDAHKCGKYWTRMDKEELKKRGYCTECSTPSSRIVESIRHVLFECKAPERERLWDVAREVCESKGVPWEPPKMGNVLGCGLRRLADGGKTNGGKTRLYRIVMSECAYMIWLARNERVIQYEGRRAIPWQPGSMRAS